jgi:hypothetical protein
MCRDGDMCRDGIYYGIYGVRWFRTFDLRKLPASSYLDAELARIFARGWIRSLFHKASQGTKIDIEIGRSEAKACGQLIDLAFQLHERLSHFLNLLLG